MQARIIELCAFDPSSHINSLFETTRDRKDLRDELIHDLIEAPLKESFSNSFGSYLAKTGSTISGDGQSLKKILGLHEVLDPLLHDENSYEHQFC